MVTNLAERLIPKLGDLGCDKELAEAEATFGTMLVQVWQRPVTHIYSEQGWLRVLNLRMAWVVQHLDEFEQALGLKFPQD